MRVLFLFPLLAILACSSDKPAPVAPAGKAADLGDLFNSFRDQNENEQAKKNVSSG